ncbi:MAG: TMEM175 family protein [Anaerolineales bacterium]
MDKRKESVSVDLSQDRTERDRLGIERLVFFSDAVFAIAMTLLVLDIRLPAGVETANNHQLLLLLTGLWHKYLAYFISFWVIGLYWISHHRKFLLIKRWDHLLLSLNLLLLMVIAFIPFPTAVMSENSNLTATVFYALVMALAGITQMILWWHASGDNKLLDMHLDRMQRWREVAPPLASVVIFLLSIGVAFFDLNLVRIIWVLIPPLSIYLRRRYN